MATPLQLPLSAAPPTATRMLLDPESAIDPVQPLAPQVRSEIEALRARYTTTAPTAFASLDLTLMQPCGRPAAGVELHVQAPRSTWKHRDGPLIADDTGRVLLPELPAETPLRLLGTDHLDYQVLSSVELSLAPREHRVLTETLGRDLRDVVVEVRFRSGALVSDAFDITLVAALTQNSTRTLQTAHEVSFVDGRAIFPCMAAERVSVAAELDGFAPAWLAETPLDRDPLLLELVLDPGFPVEVEVVDESARAATASRAFPKQGAGSRSPCRVGTGRSITTHAALWRASWCRPPARSR